MKNRYFIILRQTFKSLNWFETVLLLAILSLAVMSFFIKGDFGTNAIIAAVAAILGVFCVVLGAKGSLANWIFGVVEAFLHIYICFCTHIYGDMLQRLFYNLPMQFIGFNMWKKQMLLFWQVSHRPLRLFWFLSQVLRLGSLRQQQ